jgi:hypothetical protein
LSPRRRTSGALSGTSTPYRDPHLCTVPRRQRQDRQDRVDASRAFEKKMKALGGDVTIDVLPEAGIKGNDHTLMLEKNNKQIMFRMIAWLEGHVFSQK